MNNSRKKPKSKSKAPAKTKRRKKPAVIGITKPHGFLIRADGTLETKEERKKRLARLEALTIRAFQMAYDNYHNL